MTTTTTQPTGGALMRLERDADGHLRGVPADRTYFAATGAPTRLDTASDAATDATSDADTSGRPWRIWRATDPEPGVAPDFASFDYLARARWFGEPLADDPATCQRAWTRLCAGIARTYPGCHALRTPGATGLSLLRHTLPWDKARGHSYVYPTLPADLARLLAATSPQHRMELLTLPDTRMRFYAHYDARVAHAAYLRWLPVLIEGAQDTVIHDEGPAVPYRAGKYRVAVTVPHGWEHIGLVQRANPSGLGWDYPTTPGDEWETWLDECEVRLLAAHGWPHAVRERLLFADAKTPGADPLREHAARLAGWIEGFDRAVAATPPASAQGRELAALRHAVRAIALHPIGLWHKSSNQRPRHVATLDELTPADAEAVIVPDGEQGGYTVTVSAALSGYQAHWRRVEWSTTVYARERVQATRRALSAPRDAVLAIRGDAVHFASYAPADWGDDTGKVGAYRLKGQRTFLRLRRAPRTDAELLALAQEGEGR